MRTTAKALLALSFLFFSVSVNATRIEFDLADLGMDSFEYTYTVFNDTLSVDIDEATIFFDVNLYSNLAITSPVSGWDELVIQPEPFPPFIDDGFYDALALTAGIAPGESVTGFSLSFDWLGTGLPGAQFFEVLDSGFNVLDSGNTVLASGSTPPSVSVPEPATFLLFAAGLLGLPLYYRQGKPA